jgi:hypothetical protein
LVGYPHLHDDVQVSSLSAPERWQAPAAQT